MLFNIRPLKAIKFPLGCVASQFITWSSYNDAKWLFCNDLVFMMIMMYAMMILVIITKALAKIDLRRILILILTISGVWLW